MKNRKQNHNIKRNINDITLEHYGNLTTTDPLTYGLDLKELHGQTLPGLTIVSTKDVREPIVSEEEKQVIKDFFNKQLDYEDNLDSCECNPNDPWIQTYSGRRFTPTNPNPNSIVIQDIAHSLSLQCRFTGHIKEFYSVAQHSVLVSYICDSDDALWGLLHDSTEAYLVDLPAPLKRSGQFNNFKEIEAKLTKAVCKRFDLPMEEPKSVKMADKKLLVTEARDLFANKRNDWLVNEEPLPFKIEAWGPSQAEDNFMKRFYELKNTPAQYEHYLYYKNKK